MRPAMGGGADQPPGLVPVHLHRPPAPVPVPELQERPLLGTCPSPLRGWHLTGLRRGSPGANLGFLDSHGHTGQRPATGTQKTPGNKGQLGARGLRDG